MSQAGIVDVENSHPQIPTTFDANVGSAIPIANTLNIFGTTVAAHSIPLETVGSGMTITVEAQYASSAVSSVATNAGVASFNSNDFTVDANGYVSMSAGHGGITWQDISASQTMGVDNGYICISPGGALSLALPPTSSVGTLISIILDGSTSFTITQSAGQTSSWQIEIQQLEFGEYHFDSTRRFNIPGLLSCKFAVECVF